MRKRIILVALLTSVTIASMSTGTTCFGADSIPRINLTYGSYITYVNQRVELTINLTGWGTPPYSYQWYTTLLPQDVLDDHIILPDRRMVRITVPGATYPEFNFTQSTPGTYNIELRVVDATGHTMGIASRQFITVQALPSPSFIPPEPQITQIATPSVAPTSTPTNPITSPTFLTQTPEPFQLSTDNLVLVTVFISAIALILAFLVYFRKHKT